MREKIIRKEVIRKEEGEKYKKESAEMDPLAEIEKKIKAGQELPIDELKFLYENAVDSKFYEEFVLKIKSFNQRIEKIREGRDIKSDLASITGLSKEHISISREEFLAGKGKIKFHYGELALSNFQAIEVPKFPENFIGTTFISVSSYRPNASIFPKISTATLISAVFTLPKASGFPKIFTVALISAV